MSSLCWHLRQIVISASYNNTCLRTPTRFRYVYACFDLVVCHNLFCKQPLSAHVGNIYCIYIYSTNRKTVLVCMKILKTKIYCISSVLLLLTKYGQASNIFFFNILFQTQKFNYPITLNWCYRTISRTFLPLRK